MTDDVSLYPWQWVESMADAGATRYIFHIEATDNPARCVRKIKEANMKVCLVQPLQEDHYSES